MRKKVNPVELNAYLEHNNFFKNIKQNDELKNLKSKLLNSKSSNFELEYFSMTFDKKGPCVYLFMDNNVLGSFGLNKIENQPFDSHSLDMHYYFSLDDSAHQ